MMNNGVMQDIGSLANSVTGDAPPYGKACAGCGARILDRFLLHAMDRYWHTGCLKCSCCQTNLEQLGSCFTRSGMILCKNDYLRYVLDRVLFYITSLSILHPIHVL
jgi:hypothetical protein